MAPKKSTFAKNQEKQTGIKSLPQLFLARHEDNNDNNSSNHHHHHNNRVHHKLQVNAENNSNSTAANPTNKLKQNRSAVTKMTAHGKHDTRSNSRDRIEDSALIKKNDEENLAINRSQRRNLNEERIHCAAHSREKIKQVVHEEKQQVKPPQKFNVKSEGLLLTTCSATAVLQDSNRARLIKRDVQLCSQDATADKMKTQRIIEWLHDCQGADKIDYPRLIPTSSAPNCSASRSEDTCSIRAIIRKKNELVQKEINNGSNIVTTVHRHINYKATVPSIWQVDKMNAAFASKRLDTEKRKKNNCYMSPKDLKSHQTKEVDRLSRSPSEILAPGMQRRNPIRATTSSEKTKQQHELRSKQNGEKNPKGKLVSKLPVRSKENLLINSWLKTSQQDVEQCGIIDEKKEAIKTERLRLLSNIAKDERLKKWNFPSFATVSGCNDSKTQKQVTLKETKSSHGREPEKKVMVRSHSFRAESDMKLNEKLKNRLWETKAKLFLNRRLLMKTWLKWRTFILEKKKEDELTTIQEEEGENKQDGLSTEKDYWYKDKMNVSKNQLQFNPQDKMVQFLTRTTSRIKCSSPLRKTPGRKEVDSSNESHCSDATMSEKKIIKNNNTVSKRATQLSTSTSSLSKTLKSSLRKNNFRSEIRGNGKTKEQVRSTGSSTKWTSIEMIKSKSSHQINQLKTEKEIGNTTLVETRS